VKLSYRSWKSPLSFEPVTVSGQSNPALRLHGDHLADFFGFAVSDGVATASPVLWRT